MGNGQKYQPIRRHVSKAAEQALRIAGVFAIIDNTEASQINTFCLERAIILVHYYLEEIFRIHGMSVSNPDLMIAQQVLDWFKKTPGKVIPLSELYQSGPPAVRSAQKARAIISILEDHCQVQKIRSAIVEGKVVREAWMLNPAADPC